MPARSSRCRLCSAAAAGVLGVCVAAPLAQARQAEAPRGPMPQPPPDTAGSFGSGSPDPNSMDAPAPALAEGTFVPPRTATIVRGRAGGWYAVFHPEPAGPTLPPMGLIPCAALERVEAIALRGGQRATVRVSGQVYAYRGRNYLLLATVWSAAEQPSAPPTPEPPAAPPDAPPAPATEAADPSVEELIRDLEAPRREPRALEAPPPLETPAADTPAPGLTEPQREAFLVRRKARIVRLGGAWAVVFDADPGGGNPDAPLLLAPCQATEALEPRAAARGDSLIFELSGRLTTYRGRTWVLPTLAQPFRLPDVMPMQ